MAITDLKGTTWILNDVPVAIVSAANSYIAINFESNGQSFSYFIWDDDDYISSGRGLKYTDGSDSSNFKDDYIVFAYNRTTEVWSDEALKTVTFTSNIDVAKSDSYAANNFISWLEANATLQKPKPTLTYDLTSLNLGEGTHNISVIGKADGYKNSAASASVEFTVEPPSITLAAGTYVGNDTITPLPITNPDDVFLSEVYPLDFTYAYAGVILYGKGMMWTNVELIVNMDGDSVSGTGLWYNTDLSSPASGKLGYLDTMMDNETHTLGWQIKGGSELRVITLETDQTVSAEFGEWFNANFTKQPDVVTLEEGTYVANFTSGTISYLGGEYINFTSNGTSYYGMQFNSTIISYIYNLNGFIGTTVYNFTGATDIMGWQNTAYKTITIYTDQTVSVEFGEWFNTHFTKTGNPEPL